MYKYCGFCEKEYREGHELYNSDVCICGAALETIDEINLASLAQEILDEDEKKQSSENFDFFDFGQLKELNTDKEEKSQTQIFFETPINSIEETKGDNLPKTLYIYKKKTIIMDYALKYDEIIIGRKTADSGVDIDLTPYDDIKAISRKHAMIYRKSGKFYIRKISENNSIFLNGTAIKKGEDQILNLGDRIILGKEIGIKVG